MTTDTRTNSRSTSTTRRYWRRSDTPQPWWPWGLLPVFGLGLLFLFGALVTAPDIQAEIRTQVAERLDSAGVVATDVATNGRRVSARVNASGENNVFLQALAQSTTCDTWAGELTCPTIVDIEVDTTRDSVDAAPAKIEHRPHQFDVVREGNAITLRGEVPTVAERERILGVAGEYFGQVQDELTISNESASANFVPAADRALAVVNNLVSGHASWSGESLSVSGMTDASDIATVREQFEASGAASMLGTFDVQALEQTNNDSVRCNDAFGEELTNATIRFQTNSATIDDGNEELLERLARLARGCPGKLTIEGHTDSRGDADMNKALSLARAAAVRDALAAHGIDADRVTAVGFGEISPIADNASAEGRAKNRRIAIAVDESN